MNRLPTRVRVDLFGDAWTVCTGPEARSIRREVKREQEEALARYDAEPTPENKAAFASIADTEGEVGRRLKQKREAA